MSSVPPLAVAGQLLRTGSDYGTKQFNGSLDDIRIYNRTLSEEEVASLASWR